MRKMQMGKTWCTQTSLLIMFGEFEKKFNWLDSEKKKDVGRMYFIHPTAGERFFLHLLLTIVSGATSFEHVRTINNTKHQCFKLLAEHWDYYKTT
jgi:hypothetical protein